MLAPRLDVETALPPLLLLLLLSLSSDDRRRVGRDTWCSISVNMWMGLWLLLYELVELTICGTFCVALSPMGYVWDGAMLIVVAVFVVVADICFSLHLVVAAM